MPASLAEQSLLLSAWRGISAASLTSNFDRLE
jgi:hypothetical protein